MEIINLKLSEIKPYEKNPRKNDKSVAKVAESIQQFGMKVPLVIDKNNVIVTGHTRYKAMEQLGYTEAPCIKADDLTDEQIKAFRLADNKVGEQSEWNMEFLTDELSEIIDIDMSDFGFDVPALELDIEEDDDNEGYYGDERERTNNEYNLSEFDANRCEGFYEMPTLNPVDFVPSDLISFNYLLSTKQRNCGIHFYIDDYQFERIWNNPKIYIEKIKEFECALTPDFSLYMDMPMAMKIWNVYRSKLIGQMMQDAGIKVIPTLQWAESDTYSFCFDGLPKHSTVSVSTVGVKRDPDAMMIWYMGMSEAIKRLKPKTVIVYGGDIGYDFKDINVVYINNHNAERLSKND